MVRVLLFVLFGSKFLDFCVCATSLKLVDSVTFYLMGGNQFCMKSVIGSPPSLGGYVRISGNFPKDYIIMDFVTG